LPSAELTPIEVWSLILEESRKVINPQTFKTWLEPTEAVALSRRFPQARQVFFPRVDIHVADHSA